MLTRGLRQRESSAGRYLVTSHDVTVTVCSPHKVEDDRSPANRKAIVATVNEPPIVRSRTPRSVPVAAIQPNSPLRHLSKYPLDVWNPIPIGSTYKRNVAIEAALFLL